MEHHLEQRLGRIHLKGRFLLGYLLS
jgi:hypothetical protein